MKKKKNPAAVALGRLGGRVVTQKKRDSLAHARAVLAAKRAGGK
jgi:hypothetical protein